MTDRQTDKPYGHDASRRRSGKNSRCYNKRMTSAASNQCRRYNSGDASNQRRRCNGGDAHGTGNSSAADRHSSKLKTGR